MNTERKNLLYSFFFQLIVSLVVSVVWYTTSGTTDAFASVVGGGVCWIPYLIINLYFVFFNKDEDVNSLVIGAYLSLGVKFVLTIILIISVFKFTEVNPKPLFITYFCVYFIQWITPLAFNNHD